MENFPKSKTNWFSILETLDDLTAEQKKTKRFKVKCPFFEFDGTVEEFLPNRAEFRHQLLEYLQKAEPGVNWIDRPAKKRENNGGK